MFQKSYFLILFIIFLVSGSSVGLLLFYMNPFSDIKMAVTLMSIGLTLFSISFLAPFLFFIKKIYYRGDVTLRTLGASLRQAILIVAGMGVMIFLYSFHLYEARLVLTTWAILGCIEVMFQAIE